MMTTETEVKTLTALRASAVTSGLENKNLKKIAAITGEKSFSADALVYDAGELGQAVYVIQSGEVVIEMPVSDNTWVSVLTLGPGELFGWSSLFPTERKRARARTTEPTHLLVINAQRLRTLWQNDEDLEYAIVHLTSKVMIDRIKVTRQKLIESVTTNFS